MAERLVTQGVVLRETQTKEADKILTVLTPGRGKLAVVARGARRKASRIAAASQLFALSEMVLYESRGWYVLDEASTLMTFDGLRQDVELLALASYFAEMAECVASEGESAEELTALLLNALYALETLQKPRALVKAAFELKLTALAGYQPLLMECAVCGRSAPEEPLFAAAEGVTVCRACADASAGQLLPLDPQSLAAMRHVLTSPRRRMLSFLIRGESLRRFSRACETFARVQLDRSFRTLDYYKSVRTEEEE